MLILDSKTSAEAVTAGIRLCLQTIIPSLFPLLVVSRLLMKTALPRQLGTVAGSAMKPLFAQPPEASVCLLLGIMGGYPVGAQTVAIAYESGSISKEQGERLLSFCNNAGPAFVFGILGGLFGSFRIALTLYVIHILSALFVGIITKPHKNSTLSQDSPALPDSVHSGTVLSQSIRSMSIICGYIILFQVAIAFADKYAGDHIPLPVRVGLTGLLELSSGCIQLRSLESMGLQYCLASGFLAFGGLCVGMQTRAVLGASGLSARCYIFGKLLQSVFAVLLTWAVMVFLPGLLPRHMPALYLPNHQGLFKSTLGVVVIFLSLFGIWCAALRKKAGKAEKYRV